MYEELKQEIDDNINANGQESITGEKLNQVLNDIVDTIGAGIPIFINIFGREYLTADEYATLEPAISGEASANIETIVEAVPDTVVFSFTHTMVESGVAYHYFVSPVFYNTDGTVNCCCLVMRVNALQEGDGSHLLNFRKITFNNVTINDL